MHQGKRERGVFTHACIHLLTLLRASLVSQMHQHMRLHACAHMCPCSEPGSGTHLVVGRLRHAVEELVQQRDGRICVACMGHGSAAGLSVCLFMLKSPGQVYGTRVITSMQTCKPGQTRRATTNMRRAISNSWSVTPDTGKVITNMQSDYYRARVSHSIWSPNFGHAH